MTYVPNVVKRLKSKAYMVIIVGGLCVVIVFS